MQKSEVLKSFHHWPTFIVIGPGKTGTSWLYHVLDQHPEICMSSAKETTFFDQHFSRGLVWYQKFFKNCRANGGCLAVGEISNTYVFDPDAAMRIHETFPNVKIVSVLRNPIERAFSHFLFTRRNGWRVNDFRQAIQERPDFVSRGFYHQHLSHYFKFFEANQLHIALYDDLKKDPVSFSKDLFSFLGVSHCLDNSVLEEKILVASQPRSKLAAHITKQVAGAVRSVGFPELITKVKRGPLAKLLYRPLGQHDKPVLDEVMRRELAEIYADDVSRLGELLQRDCGRLWGISFRERNAFMPAASGSPAHAFIPKA